MKALLRKEFWEILWVAALGLIVLSLGLLPQFLFYRELMDALVLSDAARQSYSQPLALGGGAEPVGFFCAIFAAILGCLQILPERLRNLWGVLLHRPMAPTGIFLAKAIIGLGVYLVATGLPLVCFIGWAMAPGNIPAPVEWRMYLPLLAFYLAGIPYYFVGMLTGLRQARWYASRTLGLGAGVLLSVGLIVAPHLWQAFLFLLLATGFLGVAAWGSFCTNGFYRGQPAAGKRALTITVALGAVVVAFFIGALLGDLAGRLAPKARQESWSRYHMTEDGMVIKATRAQDQPVQITDMDGNPAKDSRTGTPMTLPELEKVTRRTVQVYAALEKEPPNWCWLNQFGHLYVLWQVTPQTLWYYDTVRGRLVGYDGVTRRFIGSLGPKGFAPDHVGAGDAFTDRIDPALRTDTGLYLPDLHNRSVKQFFATESQDAIVGIGNILLKNHDWAYLVLTRQFVRLLTSDGTEILKAPFQPAPPEYHDVKLSLLEPTGKFALWIEPSYGANEKAGWKLPTHVTWFDGGRETASTELPPLSPKHTTSRIEEKVLGLLMPPALIATVRCMIDEPWALAGDGQAWQLWQVLLFMSLIFSVAVCLPVGYWLTRRYCLPRSAQLGWSAFLLVSGFPGLLALLSVEEWPAREPCPNCKKLRVVCHAQCEHCGAVFSAPAKKGTEIFDSPDWVLTA